MNIELGKTYETRSGRTVRIVCVDAKNRDYPVVGLVMFEDGNEASRAFGSDGACWIGRNNNAYDLVREHIPVTYRWANVYPGDVACHGSEAIANGSAGVSRKGLIKLAFDPSGNLIVDKCEISATASSVATAVSQ